MQIYISKNNQQLGPFEEADVLRMLKDGEFSPSDLAIRHGESEWQKLSYFYPTIENQAEPQIALEKPPKKSKKGLLLGCGGFFLIAVLISGALGFLAYRNLFPTDSPEDLPNMVKDFKLENRYPPKGNIWGTETNFVGIYSDETKTRSVIYLMTVYSNNAAADDALREGLARSCQSGETPMRFSFVGKGGEDVSQGATCAVPLYVKKDNKLVTLGGGGANAAALIEFAEHLPFNEGTTMKKASEKE